MRFVENKVTSIHVEPASDNVATVGGICMACGHRSKARCQCKDYGHDHMRLRFGPGVTEGPDGWVELGALACELSKEV